MSLVTPPKLHRSRERGGVDISYEEPGAFPAPELEPPPYFTPEEIETHGWIIETYGKRTKPSVKYLRGCDCWVSTDKRGATISDVTARVREARAAHHAEWEADGRQGVYSVPTFHPQPLHRQRRDGRHSSLATTSTQEVQEIEDERPTQQRPGSPRASRQRARR